jgi:hypothetical protein
MPHFLWMDVVASVVGVLLVVTFRYSRGRLVPARPLSPRRYSRPRISDRTIR